MKYTYLFRQLRLLLKQVSNRCTAGLLLTLFTHAAFGQEKAAARPNIIVILADDMGYSDLGCYGGEASTPNLDKLAAGGLRFRTFYNAARCCPSRASLLTGLYPHEAGMGAMVSNAESKPSPGPYQGYLNHESVTLAEALKTAGYKTYMSGKWHVGERSEHWPRQRGFDRYFGLISGASSYFELVEEPRKRRMAHDDDPWFPPADNFYMTDAFTDTAVAFIEHHERSEKDRPFFLYLAYTAPHWPLHAPQEDIARYKGVYDGGWDSIRAQRYKRMQQLRIIDQRYKLSDRSKDIPAWKSVGNQRDWSDRMEVYAAMIDRMDRGIGKVLETLERQGTLENTLIIFLSDNGGCAENIDGRKLHKQGVQVGHKGSYLAYEEPWANASNTPFRKYKAWTEEGGIKTPAIVHWPQVIKSPTGGFTDAVGHVVDVMATLIDVAGATYPDRYKGHEINRLRGKSLVPVFSGGNLKDRSLYWEHFGKWAMRAGDWKIVGGLSTEPINLYNLAEDPVEVRDLSKDYPDTVEKMKISYEKWSSEVGVKKSK